MGKNLMKSNQLSAGRTQNGGFGHKSDMELILCFITWLKNKKRAPYAWECWTDWNDVHTLPAPEFRQTRLVQNQHVIKLMIKIPTKALMIVKPFVFITVPRVGRWICAMGNTEGTRWQELWRWGCLRFPWSHRALWRRWEAFCSAHLKNTAVLTGITGVGQTFYPTTVDFGWRCQKLCKDRDGTWTQLKFHVGFQ